MSSERPKLGPDIPKVITAWLTGTGRVVYLTADRDWSEDLADAEVLTRRRRRADMLAWAASDQTRATDPYFMQVTPEGRIAGRETIRETIRAKGPTKHPMFGKQAGNNRVDAQQTHHQAHALWRPDQRQLSEDEMDGRLSWCRSRLGRHQCRAGRHAQRRVHVDEPLGPGAGDAAAGRPHPASVQRHHPLSRRDGGRRRPDSD